MADRGKPWFRVKRLGYGAGLPCAWQGWVAMGLYMASLPAITLLGARYAAAHPIAYVLAVIAPTALFVFVAWRKSDGPWRWRNGED